MQQRYPFSLRVLHWTIGLLMIGLVIVGFLMTSVFSEPFRFSFYDIHKSLGLTVLGLAFIRLGIRLTTDRVPQAPSVIAWYERLLARLVYLAFYIVMFGLPISGYVMSVTGGHPVAWFGISVPSLLEKNEGLGHLAHEVHEAFGYIIIALLVLHIGGVIVHAMRDRINLLKRMW